MSTPNADSEATLRVDSDMLFVPRYATKEEQFAPGSIIAGRYRIAGILGAGGMGEVYRADDIKLGQAVALKFLPARLARDPLLLARLHDEVRHGRQVAHPNVCRIYDIGESDGAHFLAMELVDGEDLARLLRRIGHLAHDKAVDIARGIAAGLLAAHAKGILHRDLKPANVMIDSYGEARITDFGLALTAEEDQQGEVAGTPAYMAPEQLEGAPATVQSDLYALGLVMYELFTGKRAHAARTLPERVRDSTSEITIPSAHIRDLDPAVERVILRCLSVDPAQRPRSARAVIEALPGGDPLAAAMAAGETPSPRIVAAAGTEGSLSPRAAWLLLGTAALLLVILVATRSRLTIPGHSLFERPPEVLSARADELLRQFGLPAGRMSIRSFYGREPQMAWLEHTAKWASVRNGPSPVVYRVKNGIQPRQSATMDVMANAPGYTSIEVDPKGRLVLLLTSAPAGARPRPTDWKPLLAAAGLDGPTLRPVAPAHTPLTAFDARAAWSGTYPGDTLPIRVEAAAWRGTPVYFRVLGPWDASAGAVDVPFANRQLFAFVIAAITVIILGGIFLAWRNLRLRRGDRQGALRTAGTFFVLYTAGLLLGGMYSGDLGSDRAYAGELIGRGLLLGAIVFLLYIGLEPYVRRRWPTLLIASSRLLGGRFRDPMVGRDVLIGLIAGLFHSATAHSTSLVGVLRGALVDPGVGDVTRINAVRFTVGSLLGTFAIGLFQGFIFIVLLVLLAMLLRKRRLAIAAFAVLVITAYAFAVGGRWWLLALVMPVVAALVFVVARYGLLAVSVAQSVFAIVHLLPIAGDAAWARPMLFIVYGTLIALAVWAFHTALGGRPAFAADAMD